MLIFGCMITFRKVNREAFRHKHQPMEFAMIAAVKSFFQPQTEVQHLRRVVGVLIALLAISWVSVLVYGFKTLEPQRMSISDSDKLGMIILSERASRK